MSQPIINKKSPQLFRELLVFSEEAHQYRLRHNFFIIGSWSPSAYDLAIFFYGQVTKTKTPGTQDRYPDFFMAQFSKPNPRLHP
ncbi:MAG TPA: hypothetical protein DEB69_04450 [Candidatus Komeilibacteria bacterium]|nr:hypothetical protein [Candidatus Komeilibacteria bacterium]HBV02635.1 hypothetical protein [Candidatus Komeilibacteria bacterium]